MVDDAGARIRRALPDGVDAPRPFPLLTRIAGERAAERTVRVLAFAFLPGGVVFGLLLTPVLAAQHDVWPPWWTGSASAAVIVPPVLLGALAFLVPVDVLRTIAAVSTGATLLVLASAPLVLQRAHALAAPPWVDQIAALGLIASVIAVRGSWTIAVAVLGAALTFRLRLAVQAEASVLDAAQNAAYVLLFTVTFLALGVSALVAARAADAAEEAAETAGTRAAADAARDREQARINGLVHDRVLATLLTAARPLPGSEAVVRRDAARALHGLQALLDDEDPLVEDVDAQTFVWRTQGVTTQLDPQALFRYDRTADLLLPGEVAETLLTATEEALRNSLGHAGPANRTVHVLVTGEGVEVNVLDDGVGFDPAAVPPARLGIARSIEGRMRDLPGGGANVISTAGVGTRVVLSWSGP